MIGKSDSLGEIERRAYRSTFTDGIYDIQFGLIFLAFALIAVLELAGISRFVGYSLLIFPLVLPWLGKRYITIPRLGQVEFGEKRTARKRYALLAAGICFVLTLPILLMIISKSASGILGWKLVTVFAAPVFVLAVYTVDFPRLYIYAALLFVAVVESEFLLDVVGAPLNTIISFGIPGVIITTIGIAILINFIKTHKSSGMNYAG